MKENKQHGLRCYAALAIIAGTLAPLVWYLAHRIPEELSTAFMPIMAVAVALGLPAFCSFTKIVKILIKREKKPYG